jgi:uncharacterized protein
MMTLFGGERCTPDSASAVLTLWSSTGTLERATANRKKHGIDFHEAATVLQDTLSNTFPDPDHSTPAERRFVTVGISDRGRVLVVVHTEQAQTVRIISARSATRHALDFYEEAQYQTQ